VLNQMAQPSLGPVGSGQGVVLRIAVPPTQVARGRGSAVRIETFALSRPRAANPRLVRANDHPKRSDVIHNAAVGKPSSTVHHRANAPRRCPGIALSVDGHH
jgi:hypothetical protein